MIKFQQSLWFWTLWPMIFHQLQNLPLWPCGPWVAPQCFYDAHGRRGVPRGDGSPLRRGFGPPCTSCGPPATGSHQIPPEMKTRRWYGLLGKKDVIKMWYRKVTLLYVSFCFCYFLLAQKNGHMRIMRLVTSRPSFLGVLPPKKTYRKALAFSESPKRAESVWVATLMVSSSAQGEAVAGCNRTRNCLKKWGRFPTKLWYFGTTYFHLSEVSIEALGPPGPAVTIFRDGMKLRKPKERIRFLGYQSYWEMVQVDWMSLFSQQSSSSQTLAKNCLPQRISKHPRQKNERASRLIPGVRSLVMKLSLFHSLTTVARGTAQIITGIPDSHHGCFMITPLIRVPNWWLITHEISNNWRKLHCMMQKNPKSSDVGSTEEQTKHRILGKLCYVTNLASPHHTITSIKDRWGTTNSRSS